MIKLLFLQANPYDSGALQLAKEFRRITEAIQDAPFGKAFNIKANWATQPGDLQKLLLDYQPDILHYTGHGVEDGSLVMQNEQDMATVVPVEAFANLVKNCPSIKLLVLNSCYSYPQADDIAGFIDYVVCTLDSINDPAAISFSEGFYRSLAYGQSVYDAYKAGINNAQLHGFPEDAQIVKLLAKNGIDHTTQLVQPDNESKKTFKRYFTKNGFRIGVEKEAGETRFDHANPLTCHYGAMLDLKGLDGDLLDIIIGDDLTNKMFKIVQLDQHGNLDEYKIVCNSATKEKAKDLYCNNWPPQLFGGISQITPAELHLYKMGLADKLSLTYEAIQDEIGYLSNSTKETGVIEKFEARDNRPARAKITRSLVAPGFGEKLSNNDVFYLEDMDDFFIESIQKTLLEGTPIICRLGHPTNKNQDPNDLPEISLLKWFWKDPETGRMYSEDLHCFTNDLAIKWAEKAAKKEWLPRSWEAKSYCEKVKVEGLELCYPVKLLTVAWLDPQAESQNSPGFDQAKMVELVELQESFCCSACKTDKQNCIKHKPPLIGDKEKTMSVFKPLKRGKLSDEVLKVLVSMAKDADSLAEAITNAGGDDSDLANAQTMWADKTTAPPTTPPAPAPTEKPLEENNPIEELIDQMLDPNMAEPMFTMMEASLKLNKARLTPLQEYKLQEKKRSFKTLANGQVNNGLRVVSANQALLLDKLMAQEEQKATREQTAKALDEMVEKALLGEKWLGVHDLSNRKQFPVESIIQLKKEALHEITNNGKDLAYAASYILGRLDAVKANAILFENGLPNQRQNAQVQPLELFKRRTMLDEIADRKIAQIDQDKLTKRNNIKSRVGVKIRPIVEARDRKISKMMNLAAEVEADIQSGRRNKYEPHYELYALMIENGVIRSEASVNGASNLVTQCFLSDLVWRRIFESAAFLEICAPLLANELDPKTLGNINDPNAAYTALFNKAGTEVRFMLHSLNEPTGDGELFTATPGTSAIVSVTSQIAYDSLALHEQAVRYIYSVFQANALKESMGFDILADVAVMIADLIMRRLSRRAMRMADNIARQRGAVKVTTEGAGVNANLYAGNTVTVDGYTVTYDASITNIYKVKMGQGVTGNTIASRLLVMPEVDDWEDRNQHQTATYYPFTFTMPLGQVPIIGRVYYDKLTGKLNTEDAFPGQGHNCAIDYNHCVIAEKNSGLGMAATTNLPLVSEYWYTDLITNAGGNLYIYNLVPASGVDIKDHIDNLLDGISAVNGRKSKTEQTSANILFGSDALIRSQLVRARRWQNNYTRPGNVIHGSGRDDDNLMATISGNLDLYSTDAELAGGDNVMIGTRRGRTRVCIGSDLQVGDLGWATVNGTANTIADVTTAKSQTWHQSFGVSNPGVFMDRVNFPRKFFNEPAFAVKVIGLSAI